MYSKDDFKNKEEKFLVYDLKWKELLSLAKYFAYFPFIEFVIVSGSMATGNIKKHSDFDLLISTEKNRLYLTRYFLLFFFGLLGKRRLDDNKKSSPNKFCFNHFITKSRFKLTPFDNYGPIIYKNLIPVYGNENKIKDFFKANIKYNPNPSYNILDLRYKFKEKKIIAKILEKILSGKIGNFLEKISFQIAKKRLEKYIKAKKYKASRVIIEKEELATHFLN